MWAVIVVLVAIVVFGSLVVVRRRLRTVERVVVVLDTERTIKGVLVRRSRDRIELGDVTVMVDGVAVPADGRMFIDRRRIEWVQVVG